MGDDSNYSKGTLGCILALELKLLSVMSSALFTTETLWPRRLLRCDGDKFMSVQRSGDWTYGNVDKPAYNILSYTWGRWQLREGKALPIQDVTWKIPPVDRKGFSVEAFAKVVRHVSQRGHVWLDVGCIDQEKNDVKMSEIGRQAGIFRGAQQVYIWLSQSKRSILETFIREALKRDALEIDEPWLDEVWKGIETLFSDPWFSSLWTLQEGFLRLDATILFDDASWLDVPRFESYSLKGGPCTLLDITKAYDKISSNIRGVLNYEPDRFGQSGTTTAEKICQKLDDVGVPCLAKSHAIAIYGVSSHRRPTEDHDRIYGIMQIFGLVLGKSAHPGGSFTLSDLEDQLGEALNKENPVLAQSFIHLSEPRPNRSWCLQTNMRVFSDSPVVNRSLSTPTPYCQINFDEVPRGLASFEGDRARFADLAKSLKFQTLYFDKTTETMSKLPAYFYDRWARLERQTYEVENALAQAFGQEVDVLLIGGLDDDLSRRWLGVIAYPISAGDESGQTYWARIGVCTWLMHVDYMSDVIQDVFHRASVILV